MDRGGAVYDRQTVHPDHNDSDRLVSTSRRNRPRRTCSSKMLDDAKLCDKRRAKSELIAAIQPDLRCKQPTLCRSSLRFRSPASRWLADQVSRTALYHLALSLDRHEASCRARFPKI